MNNIDDLLNVAFIDPNGIVYKMSKKYEGKVHATGKPIDEIVIGCQYVKILFNIEHTMPLKKEANAQDEAKYLMMLKQTSELRLENWIKANYK